ncbi:MAG: hypothetical protein V4710_08475 [Verrucomicrobiota bacterium]
MKLLLLIVACTGAGVLFCYAVTITKCTTSRPPFELAALSAALESYKSDHGNYPTDPATSERLRPNLMFDPNDYIPASRFLYRALSGDADGDPSTKSNRDGKVYFPFKEMNFKFAGSRKNTYLVDAWGNPYGYSTLKSADPESPDGNNETFDLWSTGGGKTAKQKGNWVANW